MSMNQEAPVTENTRVAANIHEGGCLRQSAGLVLPHSRITEQGLGAATREP